MNSDSWSWRDLEFAIDTPNAALVAACNKLNMDECEIDIAGTDCLAHENF